MYILVIDYLARLERIKNGTASLGDVSIINMQIEILGRKPRKEFFVDPEYIKTIPAPPLVFDSYDLYKMTGESEPTAP